MADILTKGDVLEIVGGLRNHIDDRFDTVDVKHGQALRDVAAHLSQLNSKVATHEARIAEEAAKTRGLEKEVFERPSRDALTAIAAGAPGERAPKGSATGDSAPAVTKGDVKRLMAGLAVLGAGVEVLHQLGGVGLAAVKALLVHGAGK